MHININNLSDALALVTNDGKIIDANDAGYELIGVDKSRLEYKHIEDLPEENWTRLKPVVQSVWESEKNQDIEFEFLNGLNELKHLRIYFEIIKNDKNQKKHIQILAKDITLSKMVNSGDHEFSFLRKQFFEILVAKKAHKEKTTQFIDLVIKLLNPENYILYQIGPQINTDSNQINFQLEPEFNISDFSTPNAEVFSVIKKDFEPVFIQERETKSQVRKIKSELFIPFVCGSGTAYVLYAFSKSQNKFNLRQFDLLHFFTSILQLNVKNEDLFKLIESNQREIILSNEILKVAMSKLNFGMVYEDGENRIAFLNKQFLDIFKIEADPSDFIGMHYNDARNVLKSMFKNPEHFIEDMLKLEYHKHEELGKRLVLADDRIVERSYYPIFQNENVIGHLWVYIDATIQHQKEQNLIIDYQKYMNIIENMGLGLMEVDKNDEIISVNQATCKMTGYAKEELIGQIAHELLVDNDEGEVIRNANRDREEKKASSYELRYFDKTQQEKYMLISGGPNFNDKGEVTGSIGVHFDITKIKMLEKAQKQLIDDLNIRNKKLSNYAHVVSHDLKSPLRSISAALSWLEEENSRQLSQQSKDYLEIVDNALQKMDKLINDTLNFAEINNAEKQKTDLDLSAMIQKLCQNLSLDYPKIKIEAKGEFPTIRVEEAKIIQVFQNLMENACKYSDQNKKSFVNLKSEICNEGLIISVKDNGIGIEKKFHNKIFDAFSKLGNSENSSGMGLYIVKDLVQSFGGKITIDSKYGEGSTFTISFPAEMIVS